MAEPYRSRVRIFGHPVHPLLVHFPVALWTVAPLAGAAACIWRLPIAWLIGWGSAAGGVAMAALAITAGLVDYAGLPAEGPVQRAALRHLLLMSGAWTAYLAGLLPAGPMGASTAATAAALALWGIGLVLMAAGGHFGARLVYDFGVGQTGNVHEHST